MSRDKNFNIIIAKDKEDKSQIEARGLLKGAAVLVVALSFNDFAKSTAEWLFPLNTDQNKKNKMFVFLAYFILVLVVVVFMIEAFNFASKKINGKDAKYKKEAEEIKNLLGEINKTTKQDPNVVANYRVYYQ